MKKSTPSFTGDKKETPTLTMSDLALQEKGQGASENVFAYLAGSDEHERHHKNSRTIGHVLVKKNTNGELEAAQFAIKQPLDAKSARVREMTNIQKIVGYRNAWFRAKDTDGNKYIARRKLTLQIQDEEPSELHYLSPYEYDSSDADEFSDDESVEILRNDLTEEERHTIENMPQINKVGTIDLVANHIRQRDANSKRSISQNDVMGQSAKDAYEDLFNKMKDYLSPKFILILKRAIEASLFISPENEFRPEWLHKIAHSLSLISNKEEDKEHNPQQRSNLGAAGKWANTEMMILERIAKWFSLSDENAKVTLTSFFNMLFGSEVIQKIHLEVKIELRDRFIRFIKDIDVFKEYPTFRKTSDLAQTIAIVDAIFTNRSPIRTEKVVEVLKKHKAQTKKPARTIELTMNPHENESEDLVKAFHLLSLCPEYAICERIQDKFIHINPEEPHYIVTIIDLETTGLDASQDEIIELAMLSFAVSKTKGILGVVCTYDSLNEPSKPISPEITRITGITNEQLKGQRIQYEHVREMLSKTKYVLCHNAGFDGAFLAQQTPLDIQEQIKNMRFACTLQDINWYAKGYDPRKLDYLNFKLGYFYDAHRALSDCFATLNLLRNVPLAFDELIYNAHKKHMYFFSNRLIGKQFAAPISQASETKLDESRPAQSEINEAYALLSSASQYKIYKAVPKPLPIASLVQTQSDMTIIDLKTTGNDFLNDQITAISVLSFSKRDGVFVISDSFVSVATAEQPINWDKVADILSRTQCLLSHKNSINRKFLEFCTPCDVQCRVRVLPCANTSLEIDWKNWKASNNSLKYLSYIFGYYFDPDCLVSQNYATLNLLQVVPGVFDELLASLNKTQTIILLTGPFCTAINNDLKNKGFQWSTGSGKMGKGWWGCVAYDKTADIMQWLWERKEQSPGKNEIYFKSITPLERYSIRAEFKAAEMKVLTAPKTSNKRPLDDETWESIRPK